MSSTRKTPGHCGPAYNLLEPAAAGAATAATAAEAVTAAMDAEAAEAAESAFGGAAAAAAAEPVGYGPDLAGFGLANESPSESKNIQHALASTNLADGKID
jgi:hypothetical protein